MGALAHPFRNRYDVSMTITLKNVPRGLHQALKRQAKVHKRSLNQEALSCLEEKLKINASQKKAFAEIIRFRQELANRGFKAMKTEDVLRAIHDGRE